MPVSGDAPNDLPFHRPAIRLDDAACDRLFADLADTRLLGLAVSGGPDSTALALLADAWARRHGGPDLVILTVDHGLRPSSTREADGVLDLATHLGRTAERLVWRHDGLPPATDIEARARDARYALLVKAARAHGLEAILLAHTLDDLAETFLMRLARGSGVRGLSAMARERTVDGVRFLRPLLDVTKADLLDVLAARGASYVVDPSNRDDRFLRARVRALMPALSVIGVDPSRIAATARRLSRAEEALERMTDDLEARASRDHGGAYALSLDALADAPDEIVLRLIANLLRRVRPADHPPRAAALERWLAAFLHGNPPRRATMAGVTLWIRRGELWIYAEAGRNGFPRLTISADGVYLWDGRFSITVEGYRGSPLVVVAGGDGRPDLPKAVAASLPLVETEDGGCVSCDVALSPLRRWRPRPGSSPSARSPYED